MGGFGVNGRSTTAGSPSFRGSSTALTRCGSTSLPPLAIIA